MAKPRVDYERRFYIALRRILDYMTPEQMRRHSEKQYGLGYAEMLEMVYENVRGEAKAAIAGYRRKKRSVKPEAAPAVGQRPEIPS